MKPQQPTVNLKQALFALCISIAVTASLAISACSDTEETPAPTSTPLPTATHTPAPANTPTPLPEPTHTPLPTATPATNHDYAVFADIQGIIDPSNFGWPRSIETSEGTITIDAPAENAHMLSLGHAEIMLALLPSDRLAAAYSFYADPAISNIADLVTDIDQIGSDPEEVVALQPELVIASRYTNPDLIDIIQQAGIPVMRASLENSALGNIPNILLMAYALGAEDQGIRLTQQIQERLHTITSSIQDAGIDLSAKPRVLVASRYFEDIWVAGAESTQDGIIDIAGGRNAAEEAGIHSNMQSSIEGIVAMNPEIIIIDQPEESALAFLQELKADDAMAQVPAVKNDRIHTVPPRYFATLSHWNIRGIETLAQILHPEIFENMKFDDFEPLTQN